MYVEAFFTHVSTNDLSITVVTGLITLFNFTRLLVSLKTTETLGPIITTIIYMFNDVLTFLAIYLIVIIMFTSFGVVVYVDVEEIGNF